MKLLHLSVVLVGLVGLSPAATLKSQSEQFNAKIHQAMLKKDAEAFKSIMKPTVTPDFVYTEDGRKSNFDQMCAGVKMGLAMLTKVTVATTKILKAKESGDTGTTTSLHTMGGTIMGPDKKAHTMVFSGTSTETFKKVHGKWLMSSMTWRKQTVTQDGKNVDPSKMVAPPSPVKKGHS